MIKSFDIKNFKDKSSFEVSKIFKKNYIDYKNSANTSNSKLFFKQNTKNIDKFLFQIFSYLSANSFNPDYAIGKFQSKQTYYKI